MLTPPLRLSQSQRITASHTLITLLNKLRRSLLLVPLSQRPARQTRAASKTRSGPAPRLSPRRKKRTSSLDLVERLSVSVSASKSKSLTSTNDLSSLLNKPVAASEVDEVVTVVTDPVAVDVEAADAETSPLADVVPQEVVPQVHPSRLMIPPPSPAWEHKPGC